jgi:hypothetical protein
VSLRPPTQMAKGERGPTWVFFPGMTPPTMLQLWFILALITWSRGFFVELGAGVDEEAGER